jgi:hypothetical protein
MVHLFLLSKAISNLCIVCYSSLLVVHSILAYDAVVLTMDYFQLDFFFERIRKKDKILVLAGLHLRTQLIILLVYGC